MMNLANVLVIGFPEGGKGGGGQPGLMGGNTGTLWGLCNKIYFSFKHPQDC